MRQVGYEIAYALTYLKNGFHTPVMHRNLSTKDVFLDENYVGKISRFFLSMLILRGEEHLMVVVGTNGHAELKYMTSSMLMKNTDVFLVGFLFLNLLANRCWIDMKLLVSDHMCE